MVEYTRTSNCSMFVRNIRSYQVKVGVIVLRKLSLWHVFKACILLILVFRSLEDAETM
jgi:hypothetical protein